MTNSSVDPQGIGFASSFANWVHWVFMNTYHPQCWDLTPLKQHVSKYFNSLVIHSFNCRKFSFSSTSFSPMASFLSFPHSCNLLLKTRIAGLLYSSAGDPLPLLPSCIHSLSHLLMLAISC
jgi:hypothetical protein